MRALRISPELSLPAETVTETVALLSKKGAGKTYAASVLVEEMLGAGLQVVVVDAMGAWYGLRSSADGKGPGFPIAILGGDHGDVPLEPAGGILAADLVVDERLSVVLDLAAFSKTERRRFVTDFLERLYHRNREAMHVVLEEADLFAPQRAPAGEERMLGAVYDLVRRGRQRGLGSTLITQRSASIAKEVLEQAEILIALRTTGPRDRKAIEGWIDVHGEEEARDEVLASLPSLPTGTAWVWWPVAGILRRVRIRERRTFDSSATPKPGEARRAPKTVADVDLEALRERMAATIERAKADDPRELRRRIAELERELARRPDEAKVETVVETVVERVEVPVLGDGQLVRLEKALGELGDVVRYIGARLEDVRGSDSETIRKDRWPPARPRPDPPPPDHEPRGARAVSPRPTRPASSSGEDGALISSYAASLLKTMAKRHPLRLTRSQVSTLSGRRPRSSAFAAAMAEILREGMAVRVGGQYELTDAGRALVEADVGAPDTTEGLLRVWREALPGYERDLFDALVAAYPEALSRDELAERTGRSITSSAFAAAISTLAKNGLAEARAGTVRASDTLFIGG